MDSARRPLLVVLALVALGAIYPLGRLAFGSGIGEPCRSKGDCRAFWDARCMRTGFKREDFSYCTRSCSSASDCPEAWACGSVVEMKNNALGDDAAMCIAPERAPTPDPIDERVRALFDGGSDLDRGELRGHVAGMALRLAQRAHDLHAADLAKACFAIEAARSDCSELDRALGSARAAAAQLGATQRAQIQDSMDALDRAALRLCDGYP
jgi:hypothetical protein